MVLNIGDTWITSDRVPQVAFAAAGLGWVLSWRSGLYDREQVIAAMMRAEAGDPPAGPVASPPVP